MQYSESMTLNRTSSWNASYTTKKEIGNGSVDFYNLDDQLALATIDNTLFDKIILDFNVDKPQLMLTLFLTGTGFYKGSFAGIKSDRFTPGSVNLISFCHNYRVFSEKDDHMRYFTIYITSDFLKSMAQYSPSAYLDSLIEALENPGPDNSLLYQGQLDPRIQMVLHDISNPPFSDSIEGSSVNHIFLKSKVLELIALFLNRNPAGEMPPPKQSRVNSDEREKLELAKSIITSEFENPPTLAELAKRIYLNEFKLKKGFKQTFGTTVYGYVRDYRLVEARRLLEKGDMNVSEVSLAIGYNSPGFFASSFKKKYGVNPGELLADQQKYISY